jgi:hypothetical protein
MVMVAQGTNEKRAGFLAFATLTGTALRATVQAFATKIVTGCML